MPLDIFCNCTARFVSGLVGNPEDRFSHNDAQMVFAELDGRSREKNSLLRFPPGVIQTLRPA